MNNQDRSNRVLVEVDVATLERLLARRAITVEEFRSVDTRGKHCVQTLFLSLLNRRLALL
jgi:hypothetical protein